MGRTRKPRKRYTPKPVSVDTVGRAIDGVATLLPHQKAPLIEPIERALDEFRRGVASPATWCTAADALNVAEALAEALADRGIASDHRDLLRAGQQVLADVHMRHAERGSFVLKGPELMALDDALFIARTQIHLCSQAEMAGAIRRVKRVVQQALRGNASPGTTVVVGSLGRVEVGPDTTPA